MTKLLSEAVKITPAILPSEGVAGTDDTIDGATLDMAGYDGVLMEVVFGVITASAVTTVWAEQGAESDLSDAAALLGSGQSVAADDDDETYFIDLFRPAERYVRVAVTRATANAVISSATYIQYRARNIPTTHGSGVTGEAHISPAEGTA